MRSGRLLAEDSPNNLLGRYGSTTLEEVFLILSSNQGPVDNMDPIEQSNMDQGPADQGAGTLPMAASSTEALHQANGDLTTVRRRHVELPGTCAPHRPATLTAPLVAGFAQRPRQPRRAGAHEAPLGRPDQRQRLTPVLWPGGPGVHQAPAALVAPGEGARQGADGQELFANPQAFRVSFESVLFKHPSALGLRNAFHTVSNGPGPGVNDSQRPGLHLHLPGTGGGRVLHGHRRRPAGPATKRRQRRALRQEPVQLRRVPERVRCARLHVLGRHGRRLRPAGGQLLGQHAVVRLPRLPRPQHGQPGEDGDGTSSCKTVASRGIYCKLKRHSCSLVSGVLQGARTGIGASQGGPLHRRAVLRCQLHRLAGGTAALRLRAHARGGGHGRDSYLARHVQPSAWYHHDQEHYRLVPRLLQGLAKQLPRQPQDRRDSRSL